jgi:hypothetical protein
VSVHFPRVLFLLLKARESSSDSDCVYLLSLVVRVLLLTVL